MNAACPDRDTLRRFCFGQLTYVETERLAKHVDTCADCERRLQSFDAETDALVTEIQSVRPLERQETDQNDSSASHPAVFDHGQALDQQLSEGPVWLERFQLEKKLGTGSFGYVFRARDSRLNRTVAVKIQRGTSLSNDEDAERFLREARSAAQLQHPSIVTIFESGQTDDGVCYLIEEFVDGQTLEDRLKKGPLPAKFTAGAVADLADALAAAHREGVIHRDIKPSNIIIDREDRVHLTDFGLAKQVAVDETVTHEGQVMGTPAYMSPEQARGETHDTDLRTDVYSLGVVLYEMLTGERPFQGNRRLLLLQVIEDEPHPPRLIDERIPRDLEVICLKAMSKSPSRRYATMSEFADDLRRYVNGEPILARPVGPVERLGRWCRRYPVAAGLFMAVTVGSIVGWMYLTSLSEYFVERTALDSAQLQAEMMESINAYYSEVVDELDPEIVGLDETGTYHRPVPYPASFTIEAGRRISASESGMRLRLYSNYPFPWRRDGGPPDDFAVQAIEKLEEDPGEPVYQFTELDGQPAVRYAIARVMTNSCIQCHNDHPASPKRDWTEGEVRGVLEITRPLDRDIQRTRSGLRGAFLLMGSVSSAMLVIGFAGVLRGRAQRRRVMRSSR